MIQHLACVMDGNRRWAKQRGLPALLGHKQGIEAVKRTADFCLHHNIPYVTLYVFSLENLFKRAEDEKSYLFDLMKQGALEYVAELNNKGVRIRFVGDRSLYPPSMVTVCDTLEAETAGGDKLLMTLLFCYGGRQELVQAARALAREVQAGRLTAQQIDEQAFSSLLWTHGIPDPDLIIRSGGCNRLSNFLPYQSTYSELYFTDTLWPDIDEQHLAHALQDFDQRKRNFGA